MAEASDQNVEITKTEAGFEDIALEESYIPRIQASAVELNNILGAGEEHIRFGPDYLVNTSKGVGLSVKTLYIDGKDGSGRSVRKLYELCTDSSNRIIAHRYTTLVQREFKGEQYWRGEGLIATGIRNQGLAMPLEQIHMDLLQREADRTGQRVTWHISNMNSETLDEAKRELAEHPTPELQARVDSLIAEQERWKSVYGPGGKLGFNDGSDKDFFKKDNNTIPLENIESVDLRGDQTEQKLVASESERTAIREERMREFKSVLTTTLRGDTE